MNETEKKQLSDILAFSMVIGDYDCNPGNVGRTTQGLMKIDHGWALEHIRAEQQIIFSQELDPLRYIDRVAPTNSFNDYENLIKSPCFLDSVQDIIEKFDLEQTKVLLCSVINRMIEMYEDSKTPGGIDKTIFIVCGYDDVIGNIERNKNYNSKDILKSLSQRVGLLYDKNITSPASLAKELGNALHNRMHMIKLILLIMKWDKIYHQIKLNIEDDNLKISKLQLEINIIDFVEKDLNTNMNLVKKRLPEFCKKIFNHICNNEALEDENNMDIIPKNGLKRFLDINPGEIDELILVSVDEIIQVYKMENGKYKTPFELYQSFQRVSLFQKQLYVSSEDLMEFLCDKIATTENLPLEFLTNKIGNKMQENNLIKLMLITARTNLAKKYILNESDTEKLQLINEILNKFENKNPKDIQFSKKSSTLLNAYKRESNTLTGSKHPLENIEQDVISTFKKRKK